MIPQQRIRAVTKKHQISGKYTSDSQSSNCSFIDPRHQKQKSNSELRGRGQVSDVRIKVQRGGLWVVLKFYSVMVGLSVRIGCHAVSGPIYTRMT